jgi:hypothetical protein
VIDADDDLPADRSSFEKYSLTTDSLTIAAGAASTASDAKKSRPAIWRIGSVLKYAGVMDRNWQEGIRSIAGRGRG